MIIYGLDICEQKEEAEVEITGTSDFPSCHHLSSPSSPFGEEGYWSPVRRGVGLAGKLG